MQKCAFVNAVPGAGAVCVHSHVHVYVDPGSLLTIQSRRSSKLQAQEKWQRKTAGTNLLPLYARTQGTPRMDLLADPVIFIIRKRWEGEQPSNITRIECRHLGNGGRRDRSLMGLCSA